MDRLLEHLFCEKHRLVESLTKREGQILQLIVAGKSNKAIARELSRSERTIEYHRNRMMRKLDVHSVAELVKVAVQVGLV